MPAVAFHLPPGISPEGTVDLEDPGGGPTLRAARFGDEGARRLLDGLRASAAGLRARPVSRIVRTLGRVGERFLDPSDPLRREAEARIPGEAGVTLPMAREIVTGMARDWTANRLERMVLADFPDPGVLDGFRLGPEAMQVRAVGDRLAFHVGAGNVPGVCATSVIRSLVVKTPVLLKPGRGDVALACLFARGLADEDGDLASSLAVVYWPGGEGGALEGAALERAERVVVYGDRETLAALRDRAPVETPFVAYHHRISMGAIGRSRLGSPEAGAGLARAAARAVALFDQRGCVSPLVIWVEEGGAVTPLAWAEALAEAMDRVSTELPPGPLDPSTAARVHHLRGSAELRKAAGSTDELFAAPDGSWTVLFEPDPRPAAPCQGRTVHVKTLPDLAALPDALEPFAPVLQSVALEADEPRRVELAERLAGAGVTRITRFEDQPFPPPWWRHDGAGPLTPLVRWVGLEAS